LEKRLPALLPVVSEDVTLDELANHAPWELKDGHARQRLCNRCPSVGGACDEEVHPYYQPGMRPVWVKTDKRTGLSLDYCDRYRSFKLRQRLIDACVPPAFLDVTFDTYEPHNDTQLEALVKARAYAEASNTVGMTIVGPTGLGKSHLAVAVLRQLLEHHPDRRALFAYVPLFIERVRREMRDFSESSSLERAMNVSVLVLDDLGAERSTDFAREQLEMIINERWAHRRPMVVTQNCSHERLVETMGQPVVRRLVQISDVAVEIEGDFFS
jgi:DNA replication protein DnaC